MRNVDVTNDAEAARIIDMIGDAVFKNLAMRVLAGLRFLVLVAFETDVFPSFLAVGIADSVLDRTRGSTRNLG